VENSDILSVSQKDCMFCDEELSLKKSTKDFRRFFPNLNNCQQILIEGTEIILMPDISPLTEGHLLLISKRHYQSWAQVADSTRKEAEIFLRKIMDSYTGIYPHQSILIFEHGPGEIDGQQHSCGSCASINHAHMHLVPIPDKTQLICTILADQIEKKVELKKIPFSSAKPIYSLNSITKKQPYLFIFDCLLKKGFIFLQEDGTSTIPSQFLRMLLATMVFGVKIEDRSYWDWHDFAVLHTTKAEISIAKTIENWLPLKQKIIRQ
jgi:diadenosine tetraphosphate (Ap4A) HIT family hydrolase